MPSVTKIRRGTTAGWTNADASGNHLAAGQLGYNKDTKELKVGTGATAFADLPRIISDPNLSGITDGAIVKRSGNNLVAAVKGTDYPDPQTYRSNGSFYDYGTEFYLTDKNLMYGFRINSTHCYYYGSSFVPMSSTANLGTDINAWGNAYVKNLCIEESAGNGMKMQYNSDEEAIEFLAE